MEVLDRGQGAGASGPRRAPGGTDRRRSLVAAALALSLGAVRSLVAHAEVESVPGVLVLLGASVVGLPPLAIAKRRVATGLESGALRADAFLTGAAAVLASVSLIGIVLSTIAGIWWADAVGALAIAAVLAREGRTSVRLAGGAAAIKHG